MAANLNASIATGIEEIDEQHALLLGMIDELQEKLGKGEQRQATLDALQGMKAYASFHFSDEEGLMRRCGYEGLDEHAAAHREFVQRIANFEEELQDDSFLASLELLHFLKEWLVRHIKGKDMAFVPLVKECLG